MNLLEGGPKAPFSIATTPRCRRGRDSILWIVPFYSWSQPYNAELSKDASSNVFWVFGMTRHGIEHGLPDHLRTIYSLGQWSGTDETLALSELFPYLIILSLCRGSKWEGTLQATHKNGRANVFCHLTKKYTKQKYIYNEYFYLIFLLRS